MNAKRARKPAPAASREKPAPRGLLAMQLEPGDRMTDSTGEWQVVGRPYTTAGGESTSVRVQRPDKPGVTETRMWGSYEKVSVKRAARAEEGQR